MTSAEQACAMRVTSTCDSPESVPGPTAGRPRAGEKRESMKHVRPGRVPGLTPYAPRRSCQYQLVLAPEGLFVGFCQNAHASQGVL